MGRIRNAVLLLFYLFATSLFAQANGKLQLHFMDVGQGDGALLISPRGETVLFDDGTSTDCDKPLSYLQQLGVKQIDYHIASHYHSDHIGCTAEVLGQFPLTKAAFDRGGTYNSAVYRRYLTAIGTHRKTADVGAKIVLDSDSGAPVEIDFVALNGDGVPTTNENDLSVVAVVHFGEFDAEIGGDLSGFKTDSYEDIETGVSKSVPQVEVYKVHHHGSRYSSNDAWLAKTKPMVGILSIGTGNRYGHPTEECLERLHAAHVKTYWTEQGAGAAAEPGWDVIAGNIIIEADRGGKAFTVTHNGSQVDKYSAWEESSATQPPPEPTAYAWSKKSSVYHYSTCKYVSNIAPANLMQGAQPPAGKKLHQGCPK